MNNSIKIGLAGDFCLAAYYKVSSQFVTENIALSEQLKKGVDLSIANFEFIVTPDHYRDAKGMCVPESFIAELSASSFDVFCLANNHILDLGKDMMKYTKEYLEAKNIRTVGVGSNAKSARKACHVEVKGKKITVINVTDSTNYKAKCNSPGINPYIERNIISDIRKEKLTSDIIIVSVHSDYEFTNYPAPWKVSSSRRFVEHGADIVVHHHPHTLQGIEKWHDGLIIYSLGNFIFPVYGNNYMDKRDGNVTHSAYLNISVSFGQEDKKNIDWELTPVLIEENNISIIPSDQMSKEIELDIGRYSEKLSDRRFLRKNHYLESKRRALNILLDGYYVLRKKGISDAFNYFMHHLSSKSHRHVIRGVLTRGWY